MPNIPGLTTLPGLPGTGGGTLPGLGRGVPGGLGSLPGSADLGGGPLLPGLQPVRTPRIQGPALNLDNAVGLNSAAQTHIAQRLKTARLILTQVRMGRLEARDAAKELSNLEPAERKQLTKELLMDSAQSGNHTTHIDELRALGFIPTGKDPGQSASFDPNRQNGIGANLMDDAFNTITGIPAGIALTGKAVGEDIKDIPGNIIHGRTNQDWRHTRNEIIKPVAQNYARTYGSAIHGNFEPMKEHPLGPILDVASLVSAGLGTAARTSAALDAVRAGRVADLTDAAGQGMKVGQVTGAHPVRIVYDSSGVNAAKVDKALQKALGKKFTLEKQSSEGGVTEHLVKTGSADQAQVVRTTLQKVLDSQGVDHEVDLDRPWVSRPGPKVASVGNDDFGIHAGQNGMFKVYDKNGEQVAGNMPSQEAAVKHAQSLISPFPDQPLKAFRKKAGGGQLISRYQDATGYDHSAELENTMKEVSQVLDNPDLRVDRRTFKEVLAEVKGNLGATAAKDFAQPGKHREELPGFAGKGTSRALTAGGVAIREASDLVRAGAIYLRPAYLPNNWAGNAFMNAVHQGVYAPTNLAKSLVVDKYIGKRYTAAMDQAMGHNAANVVMGAKGKGYISSATEPLARSMGMIADQPFRRAAFLHEARRAGYSKLSDVQKLFDKAAAESGKHPKNQVATREIADIARKAQEEIVKFGKYNQHERELLRNLIFVYSWMRGATRYAGRFALQHPIQANVYGNLSNEVGNPYLAKTMGGVPNYLAGAIPVGHDSKGNPLLVNPFALNPLGTGLQAAQAVAGTANVLRGGKFDKYSDKDVTGLLNPILQAYFNRWAGGKPVSTQLGQTIAPINLAHQLEHPGSGSVFPTSRTEALGHYIGGSMFPRLADSQAIERSLEREEKDNPVARIPTDATTIDKAFGKGTVTDDFVSTYRDDLEDVQRMKDFQRKYAGSHGSSGFRNLPPANRVDAALEFLSKGYMSQRDIAAIRRELPKITDDDDMSDLASSLWGSTGIGAAKTQWDELLNEARKTHLSRQRG